MILGGENFKEIERKKIGKKSEQKQSENRAKTEFCEISQPKENFCEISTMLQNHSATLWSSLREFSQLRRRFWHTSSTSQHRSPHLAAAKWAAKMSPPCKNAPWLRNGPWLRNDLQATNQVANHLQFAKSPPSCEIKNSTCKIKVQTWKMDNSTCEINLCNLRYLLPTKLDFFSRYFV